MATSSSSFSRPSSGSAAPATTIGPGLTVEGEISGTDSVLIEGTVKGRVALTAAVHVGASAVVEADIEVTEARIAGTVTGNVSGTERVEIAAEGRLVGDVKAPRLQIAEGATFKGHVDMDN